MVQTRTLLVVGLVAALVVAGCVGSGDGGQSVEESADYDGSAPADDAGGAGGADGGGADGGGDGGDGAARDDAGESGGSPGDADDAQARAEPALIKTGEVVLEVADFDRTRRSLEQAARTRGGYVSDSGVERHHEDDRSWKTGYVVLRVPSGEFAALLSATRDEGTVVSERTETRDVSDQLVDLEARLENLRAERDRLRTFYERANSTEELLAVQRELSDVQGQIERLEARKRALEDRVAYSTLRVEVREPSPTPTPTPEPPAYHEQSLVGAFVDSVNQLGVLARAALVTVAYALPYLLVVALPLALAGAFVRRRGLR